jgi:hypothetical protein
MNDRTSNQLSSKQAWTTRALLQIRRGYPLILAPIVVAAVMAFTFDRAHFWTLFIRVFVVSELFLLICVLGVRFKKVDLAVNTFLSAVRAFSVWLSLTALVLMVFGWVSQWIVDTRGPALQVILLVIWGLIPGFALFLISTEKGRAKLFRRLKALGFLAPFAYSINVLLVAVLFFSAATYILVDHGFLRVNPINGSSAPPLSCALFYFWHSVDAVPVLKINEAFHWNQPLAYDSAWLGVTLLLFKITVIVPVIAAFASYWRQSAGRTGSESSCGQP